MRLREELEWLKHRFGATDDDLRAALTAPRDVEIPLSIFVPDLGVLEATVLELASRGLPLTKMAALLHREYSTVANSLGNARRKSVAAPRSPLTIANKGTARPRRGQPPSYLLHTPKVRASSSATDQPLPSDEILIPLTIFHDERTGPLQALVRHLHDVHGMRFAEIARMIGRDPRVINATYRRARE